MISRELPLAVESLYREPELRAERAGVAGARVQRCLQALPLRTGRDGRAARPRPPDRARRDRRAARPVRLRQEHLPATRGGDGSALGWRGSRVRSVARPARRSRALARYRGSQIAVVFQSDNLWSSLTALENVATRLRLAGDAGGAPRRARRSESSASGIAAITTPRSSPAASSSGSRSRRPRLGERRLVLADEPTGRARRDQ